MTSTTAPAAPPLSRPSTLDEAVTALGLAGATALAGGTDLMNQIRLGLRNPTHVVALEGLPELGRLDVEDRTIDIGAGVTVRRLLADADAVASVPALIDAGRLLGGRQIQAMATIGGNLCNASPAAESATPLLVHAAVASVFGPDGPRDIPLAEFWAGPGRLAMPPGSVLVSIRADRVLPGEGSAYCRLQLRRSVDIALVSASSWLRVDGDRITAARIAIGAASPVPSSIAAAAEEMVGVDVGTARLDEAIARAGIIASEASSPIDDLRSSAGYRRAMVAQVVGRSLRTALGRALGHADVGLIRDAPR